jgi:dUTP pyrophosphatase
MELKIKKHNPNAKLPTKATPGSAGYDLYACNAEPILLQPHTTTAVSLGFSAELPPQTVGLIYIRSGIAAKNSVIPANCVGVIDCDYRGEWMVMLHNLSETPYTVLPYERIAQLVVSPYYSPEVVEAEELSDTERGTGGFGSTGKL